LFLAVIDTCEVLEDDGETVLREVKFKDGIYPIFGSWVPAEMLMSPGKGVGMGPVIGPKVQERITHINPISVSKIAYEALH
jgi:hypothetical protein